MKSKKPVVLALILLAFGAFFIFGLNDYLSLESFNARKSEWLALTHDAPLASAVIFFLIYVAVTALSLPAAALLTLAGGALFGLFEGFLLVSFASTVGATLAFLASRYLLRDWVQARFRDSLKTINQGVEREGAFYLFGLRLVPLFPFFLINLVLGLTPMRTTTFYWVSQLGMLPGTLVYVNAGTQLSQLESLKGILSPGLLLSFVLLGIFPLLAKKAMALIASRRSLAAYPRPRQFDRNLIVIGAGAAGLVTSYIAAATRAKVTLIERHHMGGDCLNTGCVPSKALLRAAKWKHEQQRATEFGFSESASQMDFSAVMARVHQVIEAIEPHDSVERYTALGVECLQGNAEILDPYRVKIGNQILTTRAIVIATGAKPFVPPIPGIEDIPYLTSDTLWKLNEAPKHLMILGAGPIGCELSQAFQRLGIPVTLVDRAPRILPREDTDAAMPVQEALVREGVHLQLGCEAKRFIQDGDTFILECQAASGDITRLSFDRLLVASGRRANTEGLNLDRLGITLNHNGTIAVNQFLQTSIPTILACGDVAGPYQFTHTAAHQAWYASVNALFGVVKKFAVDYRVIPWATFTDPEVARVGLNESDAKAHDIAYEVTRYDIDDLDRAIAEGEAKGFIKVLTAPGKDTILGVTFVGHHAGDLIAEFVLAMKHGIGLNKILGTIHIYPTLAESNKYVAGQWKRSHAPQRLLAWVERWHTWRRGVQRSGN
ncbi:MAG: FAD-dependent oxidoreductase [Hahellaceae bacterium]|nr:FAD-dependent oxidoreductase [Hahellaceae bacterium]